MKRSTIAMVIAAVLLGAGPSSPEESSQGHRNLLRLGLRVQSHDPSAAAEAERLLATAGAEGKDGLHEMIRALEDPQDEVRIGAAAALESAGVTAVPELAQALSSANRQVRYEAAKVLAKLGPTAAPAVGALIDALDDCYWDVREEATSALGSIGPKALAALPVLARKLRQEIIPNDRAMRRIKGLDAGSGEEMAKAVQRVPILIERLRHHSADARSEAARELERLGPAAASAAPALIAALQDSNMWVRIYSADALSQFGMADRVLPEFRALLNDPDEYVRERAATAIGNLGPAAAAAIPVLEECLRNTNLAIRVEAAISHWRISGDAKVAMVVLVESLGSPDKRVQEMAVKGVTRIGAAAGAAVPALAILLDAKEILLRANATEALGKIGPPAAPVVPALILELADLGVRRRASLALAKIGAEAVPSLVTALDSEDASTRSWAAEALGNIGPDARAAIPALIRGLGDSEHVLLTSVGESMAQALGCIGPEAIPAIVEALKDRNATVRAQAAFALPSSANTRRLVTQALLVALSDGDENVRLQAASSLVWMGQETEVATPVLHNLESSKDPLILAGASSALARIEREAREKEYVDAAMSQESRLSTEHAFHERNERRFHWILLGSILALIAIAASAVVWSVRQRNRHRNSSAQASVLDQPLPDPLPPPPW